MKYLIAAAGTGGHINPGLAIARMITEKDPQADIRFVGTARGLENTLVPKAGYPLLKLSVRGFRRKLSLDTLKTVAALVKSFFEASRLLRDWRPDLVIGTGGYVCGPVMMMAALRKIPTLLHESNALPGVTTRLLAPHVSRVAVTFEDAVPRLSRRARVHVTGSPIRPELLRATREVARAAKGLEKASPLVLAFFGSLGSATLNRVMVQMLREHPEGLGFRLVFGTGMGHYDKVMAELAGALPPDVEVLPYLHEMDTLLAASDVAVCRAGAITVGELCVLGVPSILVPSPYVADNHQEYNARSLESRGAAVVVLEEHLSGDILLGQIRTLVGDAALRRRMSAAAGRLARRDAGEAIHTLVSQLLPGGDRV
jgi:UDP-N-acetylglucosamine--N-acetylmuramyl-(pentapeptide) pyrophosphoryl-undecaprenol N-acetylglucosamine transferase